MIKGATQRVGGLLRAEHYGVDWVRERRRGPRAAHPGVRPGPARPRAARWRRTGRAAQAAPAQAADSGADHDRARLDPPEDRRPGRRRRRLRPQALRSGRIAGAHPCPAAARRRYRAIGLRAPGHPHRSRCARRRSTGAA